MLSVQFGAVQLQATVPLIIVILFFGLAYISYESMDYLKSIGKPQIFLNFYFLFLNILRIPSPIK